MENKPPPFKLPKQPPRPPSKRDIPSLQKNYAAIKRCLKSLDEAEKLAREDKEAAHINADAALCDLFSELCLDCISDRFKSIPKYYS